MLCYCVYSYKLAFTFTSEPQKIRNGIFRALAGLVEIFPNNFALTIRGGFR